MQDPWRDSGLAERRAKSLGARSWERRERNSEQPVATERLDSIRRQKARSRVRQRWGYSISLRMVLHSVGSKNSTPQSTAQSIPPRLIGPNPLQIRHTPTRRRRKTWIPIVLASSVQPCPQSAPSVLAYSVIFQLLPSTSVAVFCLFVPYSSSHSDILNHVQPPSRLHCLRGTNPRWILPRVSLNLTCPRTQDSANYARRSPRLTLACVGP